MFGKKLLSIISLLFVGSQILKVSAAVAPGLPDCPASFTLESSTTECTVTGSTTYYCIKDNVIFGLTSDSATTACEEKITSGIHAFESASEPTTNSKINIGNTGTAPSVPGNLAIYTCNRKSCTRTFGYIKYNSNYYLLGKSGSSDAGIVSDLTAITTEAGCSGKVGNIVKVGDETEASVCINESKAIQIPSSGSADDNYIMDNANGNEFNGQSGASTKSIVINAIKGAITYVAPTNGDYCVESFKITESKSAFCTGTSCDTYFNCASELCEEIKLVDSCKRNVSCKLSTGAFSDCTSGDYIVVKSLSDGNGLQVSTEGTGTLYKCTGPTSCAIVQDDEFIPGYYKNAGDTSSPSLPYISCPTKTTCKPITLSGTECAAGNIGEIKLIGDKASICLGTGISVDLTTITTAVKYFMNMDVSNNSVFISNKLSGNKYAVMKLENGNVQIIKESNLVSSPPKPFQYTESTKYKIYESRHQDICAAQVSIVEFKLDTCSEDDIAYYSKDDPYEWPIGTTFTFE